MANIQIVPLVSSTQMPIRSSRPHSPYKIRLTILCADKLSRGRYFNFTLPDVYCKVECGSQSWSTDICRSTNKPMFRWNKDLIISKGDSILITLWNDKKSSKGGGFLGQVRIKSSDIQRLKDTGYQKLDLHKNDNDVDNAKGELIVSILSRESSRPSTRTESTATPSTNNNSSLNSSVRETNSQNQRSSQVTRSQGTQEPTTSPTRPLQPLLPTVSVDSTATTNSQRESDVPTDASASNIEESSTPRRVRNFDRNARSSSARLSRRSNLQSSSSNPQMFNSSDRINEVPRERTESHSPRHSSGQRRTTRDPSRNSVPPSSSHEVTSSRPLPKEYEVRQTSEGQVFYINKETQQQTWYDPRVPRELISANLNLDSLVGPLPHGWEKRHSQMTYFVNHNNKTTQLTDPRLIIHHERLYRNLLRSRLSTSRSPSTRTKSVQPSEGGSISQAVEQPPPVPTSPPNHAPPPPASSVPAKSIKPPMPLPDHDFNSNCKSYKDLVQKVQSLKQNLIILQPQTGHCRLEVTRNDIFEESYRGIMKMKTKELRKKLMVKFKGEEGIDYGGVAREWLFLLSSEMLNPSYGLFHYPREDVYSLQIHPHSSVNPDHLSYFHFVGRVLGLAVFHGHHIQGSFSSSFYRMLLNKPISLDDIRDDEPELHHSLKWILENKIDDNIGMTFSVDQNNFGQMQVHDLVPEGREIPVTEANKHEYVSLYVNHKFKRGFEAQLQSLLKGFHEVVPPELLLPFDEKEIEILITGCSKIDLKDWKSHTRLKHCTPDSKVVKWFWEVVESFSEERKVRLLQFVTGSPRVPLQGFKALQGTTGATDPRLFTINLTDTSTDNLPQAHTCFNRIDLPPYESKDKLADKLTQAIDETDSFALE